MGGARPVVRMGRHRRSRRELRGAAGVSPESGGDRSRLPSYLALRRDVPFVTGCRAVSSGLGGASP